MPCGHLPPLTQAFPRRHGHDRNPRAIHGVWAPRLVRSNLIEKDLAVVWNYYLQLAEVEHAFRNRKGDLAIRLIFPTRTRLGWKPTSS